MVSFTPWPLNLQGKSLWYSLWYPMDRRLGGSQIRFGRGGEEYSQPLLGLKPPIIQVVAQRSYYCCCYYYYYYYYYHYYYHHHHHHLLKEIKFGEFLLQYSYDLKIATCPKLILPYILCGFEKWCLAVREERGLTVPQRRFVNRKRGLKTEATVAGCRKCQNVELLNTCSATNVITDIRWRRVR
jgi:hypothetical protein